jgi:hypothetical protein
MSPPSALLLPADGDVAATADAALAAADEAESEDERLVDEEDQEDRI